MLEKVNIHSNVAVYVQIENDVQFGIASGKLKAGVRLPSVRELSERLEVNPNTVAKAYRDLEVMGLLYTRRGMGIFVSKGVEAKCRETCRKRILGRLHEVTQEAKAAGMRKEDLTQTISKSFALDMSPYDDVPNVINALAKAKK